MTKEFEINDILNAVDNISKIERKKDRVIEKKNNSADKGDVLTLNKSRLLSLLVQSLRCGTGVTAEHGLNRNLKSRRFILPKTE